MAELSEVARRMTGRWLYNKPTCLTLTSGDSDPVGRIDIRCKREPADQEIETYTFDLKLGCSLKL